MKTIIMAAIAAAVVLMGCGNNITNPVTYVTKDSTANVIVTDTSDNVYYVEARFSNHSTDSSLLWRMMNSAVPTDTAFYSVFPNNLLDASIFHITSPTSQYMISGDTMFCSSERVRSFEFRKIIHLAKQSM